MGVSNLPYTEFKTMATRMLKECSENLNSIKEDIETTKNNQSEMKNITKMKNTLEGIKSSIHEAEVWVSDLEDKVVAENTQSEPPKQKQNLKTEDSGRGSVTTPCSPALTSGRQERRQSKGLETCLK